MQTDCIISSIIMRWVFGSWQCSRIRCQIESTRLSSHAKICTHTANSREIKSPHLYYTTTIWMGRQHNNLIIKCWNNKLDSIFGYALNTLLDDMVPILIAHTAHNMAVKFFHHFGLLVQVHNFNSLKIKIKCVKPMNIRNTNSWCILTIWSTTTWIFWDFSSTANLHTLYPLTIGSLLYTCIIRQETLQEINIFEEMGEYSYKTKLRPRCHPRITPSSDSEQGWANFVTKLSIS